MFALSGQEAKRNVRGLAVEQSVRGAWNDQDIPRRVGKRMFIEPSLHARMKFGRKAALRTDDDVGSARNGILEKPDERFALAARIRWRDWVPERAWLR